LIKKTAITILLIILAFSLVRLDTAKANLNRISGENRFDTAVEISFRGWVQSDTVVWQTDKRFPTPLQGDRWLIK
jgi:hypothetical protein